MSALRRELLIVLILIGCGWLLHSVLQHGLFSLVPLPVFLATTITWIMKRPVVYLIGVAIVSELLVTLPLGIITAAIAVPYIVYRARGRITADPTISFVILLAVTALLQLGILLGLDLTQIIIATHNLLSALTTIPWTIVLLAWPTLTASTTIVIIVIHNTWPPEQRSIISLEGHRLKI